MEDQEVTDGLTSCPWLGWPGLVCGIGVPLVIFLSTEKGMLCISNYSVRVALQCGQPFCHSFGHVSLLLLDGESQMGSGSERKGNPVLEATAGPD